MPPAPGQARAISPASARAITSPATSRSGRPRISARSPSLPASRRSASRSSALQSRQRSQAASSDGPVVEQSDPERRQCADPPPGPAVGAAHLHELLQPHLGKDGGEVVGPVGEGGLLAGERGETAFEEVAEALAQRVDVSAVAVDEVHRHVERVVDIPLEPHAVLEDEGQHAGALRVGVLPDARPPGLPAVHLALEEGRIGEERRGDRLQRQGRCGTSSPCRPRRRSRDSPARCRSGTSSVCRGCPPPSCGGSSARTGPWASPASGLPSSPVRRRGR